MTCDTTLRVYVKGGHHSAPGVRVRAALGCISGFAAVCGRPQASLGLSQVLGGRQNSCAGCRRPQGAITSRAFCTSSGFCGGLPGHVQGAHRAGVKQVLQVGEE